MKFTRFLRNEAVTAIEMATHVGQRTAARAVGRDVVVIQDTSELSLGGRRARANGYGPVGKGGGVRGLLLHVVLALDGESGALIGLLDTKVWNRGGGKAAPKRARQTEEKESQRWLDGARASAELLGGARRVTSVSDSESDMYELFARRPDDMHLVVRACQNRRIETGGPDEMGLLFAHVDELPEQGRVKAVVPAAPGRKARETEFAIRFSRVLLRKPRNGAAADLPDSVGLTIVDVRETSMPDDSPPIHWRLLTTHRVVDLADARWIVSLYRMRWTVEEYFRSLKKTGFDIEEADIGDPEVMIKFVMAAAVAAVTVMQLVKARDGGTDQIVADVFEPEDQPILEAISTRLEGQTARQKNPHRNGSLAFAAWVIARLGGWTGYYGKPGPQVMRRGLDDYQRIKFGTTLSLQHV